MPNYFPVNYTTVSGTIATFPQGQATVGVTGISYHPTAHQDDRLTEYESYDVAGWDGYDAHPITAETVRSARHFLRELPRGFPLADVAPGADGTIGFEWRLVRDVDAVVYVEVGPGPVIQAFRETRGGKEREPRAPTGIGVYKIVDRFFKGSYERF